MSLRIMEVLPISIAAKQGLKPGFILHRINGYKINDNMDLEYYSQTNELDLEYEDEFGKKSRLSIFRDSFLPLGLVGEMHQVRPCQNHCIFCFIDQMPPGLRKSLYVKDDDYLYSRDFGNYITLTNLSEPELKRITRQHISPLYISIHTTDNTLRQKMMRYKKDFDTMAVLKRLSRAGIMFHTQIVCVPGFNDGPELDKTVTDLLHPRLNTLSIGIVPVGLTRFREKLPQLVPFDARLAKALLDQVKRLRELKGGGIVYAADEFFSLTGQQIPPPSYYGYYPQAENGIGLLSLLRQGFSRRRKAFIREVESHRASMLLLHSRAAAVEMRKIAASIGRELSASQIQARQIDNLFMGPHISVSGLLTAQDICSQHRSDDHQALILPSNMFNHDELTLDGVPAKELKSILKREIMIVHPFFDRWHWL